MGERDEARSMAERKVISHLYIALLALTLIATAMAAFGGDTRTLVIGFIILFVLLVSEFGLLKRRIVLPPLFMVLLIVLLYLSLIDHPFMEERFIIASISSILIGLIVGSLGFLIVFSIVGASNVKASSTLAAFMTFTFAIGVGSLWEMAEFGLSMFMELEEQPLQSVMGDLYGCAFGAALIALSGLLYSRSSGNVLFESVVNRFIESNPSIFREMDETTSLLDLIGEGESERLEFKSSLRTNLHTGERDKRMEKAALKSVVAFLNSDGGTLLVGVDDDGGTVGVDMQHFDNLDKFNLHFTNLVTRHIGNDFRPFIRYRLVPVDDLNVLRVDCTPADRPVFLRIDKAEEFYIRSGPSSSAIEGSELVYYIDRRFSKVIRM